MHLDFTLLEIWNSEIWYYIFSLILNLWLLVRLLLETC